MTVENIPRLKTPQPAYILTDYPQAVDFATKQWSVFWPPDEIKVEKDKQDILVNMTESERHGVITTLKLFTLYELFAGNEYWGGVIAKRFPRPSIQRMASVFSAFELGVHAPFYNKINEVLGLNTYEFYTDYVNDPILKERMEFIDDIINSEDDLLSIAGFSLVEGAVLYSSFAFLKHFQSAGKNKLLNIVRGINFSVRDENLHAEAGAWLFKTLKEEMQISSEEESRVYRCIVEMVMKIREHEYAVIDKIFEKGGMDGITAVQMKHFVDSRLNTCLENLGYQKIFEVKYNPIADWFYVGINGFAYNDFFSGIGNQYNRNWDESAFTWGSNNKYNRVGK